TGSAVDISKHLLADPTVQASTDLLFRIPLGIETTTYREALRVLALEVAPLLSEPSSPQTEHSNVYRGHYHDPNIDLSARCIDTSHDNESSYKNASAQSLDTTTITPPRRFYPSIYSRYVHHFPFT